MAIPDEAGEQRRDADDRPEAAEERLTLLADAEAAHRSLAADRLEHGDQLGRGEVEHRHRGGRPQRRAVDLGHARGRQRRPGDGEQRQRAKRVREAVDERIERREHRQRVQRRAREEADGAGAGERVAVAARQLGERHRLGGPGRG